MKTTHDFKIGDVLVREWGATMQCVSFFQVVDVKGKSTIEVAEIEQDERSTGFLAGYTKPRPNVFRKISMYQPKTLVRRVKDGKINIPEDYYSRAVKVEPGKEYYFDHCD